MQKSYFRAVALLPLLLVITTFHAQTEDLTGRWQHQDAQGELIEIEFMPNGIYQLSVNGNLLTGAEGCGIIRYQTVKGEGTFDVLLFSEEDKKEIGKLQIDRSEPDKLLVTAFSPTGRLIPKAKISLEKAGRINGGRTNH